MPTLTNFRFSRFLLLIALFCCIQAAVFAASLNIFYERVVTDSYGNVVGTQKTRINSANDIPAGNPWRDFLNEQVGGKNLITYSTEVAKYLGDSLTITLSDQNLVSSTSKCGTGFEMNLYKHVTQYTSDDSKKFVFLHELGHVAMLNSYPPGYTFSGLNYGADGTHYMDEILPNQHTAWIEGWANGFAALKNNGKVFSLDMNSDSIVASLKGNTFEEMTRNELFNGKMIYDLCNTITKGQDKVYDVLARTGPHDTLRSFIRAYVQAYPADQVAVAKLLDKNSWGKVSQSQLLDYVNNGSYQVTSAFNEYLVSRSSSTVVAGGSTTSGSTKKSFWSKIGDFFSNLFGGIFGKKSSQTASSVMPVANQAATPTSVNTEVTTSTNVPPRVQRDVGSSGAIVPEELVKAQEDYYKAFLAYNAALSKSDTNSPQARAAFETLKASKARIESLKNSIRSH